ncbi:hypothetical protein NK214_05670 [Chromobacterium sp. S0633]|uniref:phospholipase D-like domain-containing protein n=1 Tax=Chromobacterium sp. S0633 TaxID=2957805 RepID=UPI00209E530D|nr:phospholipase D-like domain-containing protein [Chromobacterium sp. S0633]MCP1289675.1 hypothetical protein [Chromobacterium sp. S0633]
MTLENTLMEAAHARPGYELSTFKEAGLPVYVLTLRILVLERKPLGPIDEAVLRAVRAGLSEPQDIVAFLGLQSSVITPVLAGLNTNELINYSRASVDDSAKVTLSAKGRLALAEASSVRPQERMVRVCFDALAKKLLFIAPEQLNKPREMKDYGYFEVPHCNSKRPDVDDIPIDDFDRMLQRMQAREEDKGELLAIRRIERRELRYLKCVTLFYRSLSKRDEIEVAFWREDGPSLEHENYFRAFGGPGLIGAQVLAESAPSMPDESLQPSQTLSAPRLLLDTVELQAESSSPERPQEVMVDTMQSVLCHEHPGLLKDALLNAKQRLLIISPWIRHQVVNWEFITCLGDALKRGVQVYIGYGIDAGDAQKNNGAQNKLPITLQAKNDLEGLVHKYKNFRFVYVGNTHRKSLVCDDSFAVTTSFNWLSFRGDTGKPRDERGWLVRKKQYVDMQFQDDLKLLEEGYSGAPSGSQPSRPSRRGKGRGL